MLFISMYEDLSNWCVISPVVFLHLLLALCFTLQNIRMTCCCCIFLTWYNDGVLVVSTRLEFVYEKFVHFDFSEVKSKYPHKKYWNVRLIEWKYIYIYVCKYWLFTSPIQIMLIFCNLQTWGNKQIMQTK